MARSPRAKPKASPPKKGGGKAAGRGGRAAPKPKRRDYAAEYRRRVARAEALGMSRSVGRGHARRDQGEMGMAEIRLLRRAVEEPSLGDQRRGGVRRPQVSEAREWARQKIFELLGVDRREPGKRRGTLARRFAEMFEQLGLGTENEAYHLFFS